MAFGYSRGHGRYRSLRGLLCGDITIDPPFPTPELFYRSFPISLPKSTVTRALRTGEMTCETSVRMGDGMQNGGTGNRGLRRVGAENRGDSLENGGAENGGDL
jgi:hypothetical protein